MQAAHGKDAAGRTRQAAFKTTSFQVGRSSNGGKRFSAPTLLSIGDAAHDVG